MNKATWLVAPLVAMAAAWGCGGSSDSDVGLGGKGTSSSSAASSSKSATTGASTGSKIGTTTGAGGKGTTSTGAGGKGTSTATAGGAGGAGGGAAGGSSSSGGAGSGGGLCNPPTDPPSMGACYTGPDDIHKMSGAGGGSGDLTGAACNPVLGCGPGYECDINDERVGYMCWPPDAVDVAVCQPCDDDTTNCDSGSTCLNAQQCARFCCTDADCGGTAKCVTTPLMTEQGGLQDTLGVGVCQ